MGLVALLVLMSAGAWAQPRSLELSIEPVSVQVNGNFVQHAGTFGTVSWRVRERLGLQLTGGGNWLNAESSFNDELVEKFRVEAQSASSLLWTWGVFAGLEVEPFAGEFRLLDSPTVRLGLVLSVGGGAGGTRHLLKPERTETPATYADTGVRFMGTFSLGARLQLGERVTLRLGIRDVLYTATVGSVNGCTDIRFAPAPGIRSSGCDAASATGETSGLPAACCGNPVQR